MTPKDKTFKANILGLNTQMLPEHEKEISTAQRKWDLSKFTTQELKDELENRGYVNGVLMYPELDSDDE